jgi:hypothetical protein
MLTETLFKNSLPWDWSMFCNVDPRWLQRKCERINLSQAAYSMHFQCEKGRVSVFEEGY